MSITYINPPSRKLNKKKLILVIVLLSLIVLFLTLFLIYSMNERFRTFCDSHIFSKNIEENNLSVIKMDNLLSSKVFIFSNYIAVINNNTLYKYNSSGNKESELTVNITTPLISANDNYIALAEKDGQKLYLLSKNGIVWEKDVEGNISRVNVNSNGYVSVILSGTAYKSVIELYNDTGDELFKTYLSNTIAVDTDVSADNKYLSFAEVNISGTLIQSNIKEICIDKAKTDPSSSISYTYSADANSLIINIKYQNKDKLVCQYDDSIHVISESSDKNLLSLNSQTKKNTFCDINLYNHSVTTSEETQGLFNTKTIVSLTNTSSSKQSVYNLDGTVKDLYCYGNRIALNLGSEIHFIDTNGWLVKKYSSSQEIRDIVIGNNIAGIIYKDKIEIVNL